MTARRYGPVETLGQRRRCHLRASYGNFSRTALKYTNKQQILMVQDG